MKNKSNASLNDKDYSALHPTLYSTAQNTAVKINESELNNTS